MMHWNYRVIQQPERPHDLKDSSVALAIHEVFYDENNKIDGWSADPVGIIENTKEELLQTLEWIKAGIEKPFLILTDLEKEINTNVKRPRKT